MDNIVFDDIAGQGGDIRPDLASRIDRRMDARMDIFPDDASEFAPAGVDQFAADDTAVIFAVVPEIRGDRSRAEVCV